MTCRRFCGREDYRGHSMKLLESHHQPLRVVSKVLLEKNRLYRWDLEQVMPKTSAKDL